MAERLPSDAELDALIEAALGEELLLPVPVDFHARVAERVHLASLQQREQVRFRNALLTGFAASIVMVTALVALVMVTKFDVLLQHGVSGGRGLMDYYTATFALSWPQYMNTFMVILLLCLGAATTWAGLFPWRGRGEMHAHRTGKPVAHGPLQMR
jgi:hypothetical protein